VVERKKMRPSLMRAKPQLSAIRQQAL